MRLRIIGELGASKGFGISLEMVHEEF